MPTLTQLEYAVAVDRLRHFGAAAKACHVSQPTLSMQLQKLEAEAGFPIFNRERKPVVPTGRGRGYLDQAKHILQQYEKLLHVAGGAPGEVRGVFKLGVIPTLAPYLIPLFIQEFSERYPNVELHIDELKTASIVEGLRQETIDAGIAATPLQESSLREFPLFYEPFEAYVAAGHPLARKKMIREQDLRDGDMWLLQDGHCFRNQVIRFCGLTEAPGYFKNIHFEAGNLETLRNLIRRTGGYTLVPHLLADALEPAERAKHVRRFSGSVPTREVSLICRRDEWKQDIVDGIREVISKSLPRSLTPAAGKRPSVLQVAPPRARSRF